MYLYKFIGKCTDRQQVVNKNLNLKKKRSEYESWSVVWEHTAEAVKTVHLQLQRWIIKVDIMAHIHKPLNIKLGQTLMEDFFVF